MAFNPTFRVLYDSSSDNLNKQISAKLAELDAEAAQIRAEGKSPIDELSDKVTMLKAATERARLETIAAVDLELEGLREKWQKNRDRHPDKEIAILMRAQNHIGGLSDTEANTLAIMYVSDAADLSLPELNELRARLRNTDGSEAELLSLEEGIIERRGAAPWISESPDASRIADYRDLLGKLNGSEVLLSDGDQGRVPVHLDDLIDWDGELEAAE